MPDGAWDAGGLLVLLTTMSDSARVDLQYRGRAGRQGEPGETRLFVSLEDDVLARRATEDERAALADAAEDGRETSGGTDVLLRAIQLRAERDTLGVIARGCANNAPLRCDRRKLRNLVVGATNLERKDRLEVLSFEEDAIVQAAGQARRRLQR